MSVRHAQTNEDAHELAARVVDPRRGVAVVAVTTQSYLREPMLDVEEIADSLGERAEVWKITIPSVAWELTEALPDGLDVYGGAVRLWLPSEDIAADSTRRHPLLLVFSPEDQGRIEGELARLTTPRPPPPEPGTDVTVTVARVFDHGAELQLAGGETAFCTSEHIARGVVSAGEALSVGQRVLGRVSAPGADGSLRVSLAAHAPDAWQRAGEQLPIGEPVEGIVDEVRFDGAWVVLLPGVPAWLPRGQLPGGVRDATDVLEVDDRVLGWLRRLDPVELEATISLLVDEPPVPRVPPRLWPDGPPWLAPADVAAPPVDLVARAAPPVTQPPAEVEPPPEDASSPAPEPEGDLLEATADAAPGAVAHEERVLEAPEPPPAVSTAGPEPQAGVEAAEREQQLAARLTALERDEQRRVTAVRAETDQLTGRLHVLLDEAEGRMGRLRQQRVNQLASLEQELRATRTRTAELEQQLQQVEGDRQELLQARRADRSALRDAQKTAGEELAELAGQLEHVDGGDPARRMLREISYAYQRLYTAQADRDRYPFSTPILGPDFLDSVDTLQGVPRRRVQEVAAHICSGRAWEITALEVHQLRTGSAGDAPALVRDDGASVWRVALQRYTPSARRLHYWQHVDGTIELARVGVHDSYET